MCWGLEERGTGIESREEGNREEMDRKDGGGEEEEDIVMMTENYRPLSYVA